MKRGLAIAGALLIVAVVALYFHGNLDRPLYNIGLNYHECARNGLGASFCGKELDEYRERINKAKHEGEEKQHELEAEEAKSKEEAQETEARIKVESEESQRKAERESNALLRQANEQQAKAERQLEGK
jgi:Skp family chaperone for outer membrane proteins